VSGVHKPVLLLFLACLLLFQVGHTIDISFTAGRSGTSVGIKDSYQVDDSFEVIEKGSACFGADVTMTDARSVSGSGDAYMHQQLYGRGGGADYTDDSILRVINAARLRDKSNSILRSTLSHVSRNTTSESSDIETILKGVQKGDHANVRSYAETGDLNGGRPTPLRNHPLAPEPM